MVLHMQFTVPQPVFSGASRADRDGDCLGRGLLNLHIAASNRSGLHWFDLGLVHKRLLGVAKILIGLEPNGKGCKDSGLMTDRVSCFLF